MNPIPLYLDTSVIGGYYDEPFAIDTRELWRLKDLGRYRFLTSVVTDQEMVGAPAPARELMGATFRRNDLLPLHEEARALAEAYLAHKILPEQYRDDGRHAAICTLARIEFLVSWNFKHLVNLRREAGFNAVNLLQGYPPLRIVSPTFLIYGQEDG